jgi:hypothetical protein
MSEEQKKVLEMVQAGQLSAEEALGLLEALDGTAPSDESEIEYEQPVTPDDVPNVGNTWLYLVGAGAMVMAIGAPLMALNFTGKVAIFWSLLCGWIPFFIGLAILTLGVWSRSARWFHLRISDTSSGKNSFVLSLPLPLTLAAWVLRLIGPFVPQLKETGVDEAILALRDGLSDQADDQPLYINVSDDGDGEQVQIYVG